MSDLNRYIAAPGVCGYEPCTLVDHYHPEGLLTGTWREAGEVGPETVLYTTQEAAMVVAAQAEPDQVTVRVVETSDGGIRQIEFDGAVVENRMTGEFSDLFRAMRIYRVDTFRCLNRVYRGTSVRQDRGAWSAGLYEFQMPRAVLARLVASPEPKGNFDG